MNTTPHLKSDHLIFTPDQVDLDQSPLRKGIDQQTYVLGAFNPGLCRLPNGNLLMMVRVAEALHSPVVNDQVHNIRWQPGGYTIDAWDVKDVNMSDPRTFRINEYKFTVLGITSLSWLLPVELNEDGSAILDIHYDKIISPQTTSQEYGIEDPRISFILGRYYMTTCCASSERHSTMLYVSDDGLNYKCMGIVLDHQNKDMLLFQGQIGNSFYALTRPLGESYLASPKSSPYHPGAAIHLASSPDLLHWKPWDKPFLRARKSSLSNVKIGGGAPPVLTTGGWLILYHGVENKSNVGVYRTFWALVDKDDPTKILHLSDDSPLLEAKPALTKDLKEQIYLNDVVFTTGIVSHDENFILASGELDLACRISIIPQKYFLHFAN
jgi:beta-1,2-mannobiose phosphorylase / 1,2-beta-oligomannan phosphorylase